MTYFVPYLHKKSRAIYPLGSVVVEAINAASLYIRSVSAKEAALAIEREITNRILRIKSSNGIVLFEIGGIPFRLKHVFISAVDGKFIMHPVPDFFSDSGPCATSPRDLPTYSIPMIRFDSNNLLSLTKDGKFVHSRTRASDHKPEIVAVSEDLGGLNLPFVITNAELNKALTDARSIFMNGYEIATYTVDLIQSQTPPHSIII